GGPGESLFPFLLRNMRRPDTLQWQPCAIRRNSPLPRDGVPETERVGARHKFDRVPNDGLRKQHNQQTGNVDVGNHESRCEPGSCEGLHLEDRSAHTHGIIDEEIQCAEYLPAYRCAVCSLQEQNHRYRRQELKQRKTHYASYRSDEQPDQSHVASPTRSRRFRPLRSMSGSRVFSKMLVDRDPAAECGGPPAFVNVGRAWSCGTTHPAPLATAPLGSAMAGLVNRAV